MRGLELPPTYMVAVTLSAAGFRLYPDEKAKWHTFAEFEGRVFELHDWKGATWTIRAQDDDGAAFPRAERLLAAIQRAARNLDVTLKPLLLQSVEQGEFYINNPFRKIHNAYLHFRDLVVASHDLAEPAGDDQPVPAAARIDRFRDIAERLNAMLRAREETALAGYAMAGMFFSATETFFDIVFALVDGPRGMPFAEFARKDWRDKFKEVLPVNDPLLKPIYDELIAVKKRFRDPIFHGLGKEARFLVPFRNQLVPVSYEHLSRSIHYTSSIEDSDWAVRALEVFDKFEDWLAATHPYSLVTAYAETGFAIPLYGHDLAETQAAIANEDAFHAWLEQQERRAEGFHDRYQ
jgi:hypothetical protein